MAEPIIPVLDDKRAHAVAAAMAPMLGIAIEPAWAEAVAANLVAVANAARLVLEFPLDDELEPAPVFRA